MVDWNPNTMYNYVHIDHGMNMENEQRNQANASGNQQRRDQSLEQRSGSLDQSPTQAEAQRELTGATGIFPSDFGGYLLHPETIQNSNIPHGTEDMSVYYQQKQPLSAQKPVVASTHEPIKETQAPPPDYTPTPESTHEDNIMFFGDSNTTEPRATSRSTLDQDGLRRGSVTTLPSASTRRRSSQQHRDSLSQHDEIHDDSLVHSLKHDTTNVKVIENQITPLHERNQHSTTPNRKPSLSERAYAAAAGVAAGITGAASSLFTTNKTDDGLDMSGPRFVVRDEYGPYKDATTCDYEPAMHGQEPCFKTNEERKPCITPDSEHPFCGHVQEPTLCGERPRNNLSGGIPQSQLHEPTRRTDLNDCNVHEGQVACGNNSNVDWNQDNDNPLIPLSMENKGIPQSQLHEPTKRTSLDDCNVPEGQVASSPKKEVANILNKTTTAASEMAAAASATLFGTKHEGIPQSQLHEPVRRSELNDTNVHEGQIASTQSDQFLHNWGSKDNDSNKEAASMFTNFKGIPQSELHEPTKRTSLNDSNVPEGQVASGPKQEQEQGGILNKISTGATAAASGVAAVATGAAATLFGTSEETKSKEHKSEPAIHGQAPCLITQDDVREETCPDKSHPFCKNVQEPDIHGERPDHFENAPTAAVANTAAVNLKNQHVGSAPTADVAATSAATKLNNQKQGNLGFAPTAAVAATSAAGLQKDHPTSHLKNRDTTKSVHDLQKDQLHNMDDLTVAPTTGLQKDQLNTGTSLGVAPTAAVAATSATGLQKDHLNSGTANVGNASHLKNEGNLGDALTAAVAATSATGLQKDNQQATPTSNKAKGVVIHSQSPEQIHATTKTESIPSDKSISSARAIKHGNFAHSKDHSPEFGHVVDSTDPSFVEKRYNKRKNSRSSIKNAFRRFSRDSGSSIDKSSIVKQDDGHRLSDAEQFKQNQQYVRVPGVTPGPSEGESQFVRVDQGSSSSQTDIPSRGSYVSGQIEHRRGSIQKVMGTIMNNKNMKNKGENAKLSGKEKIEAYKASKEVHPNDSMPIKATNLTHF